MAPPAKQTRAALLVVGTLSAFSLWAFLHLGVFLHPGRDRPSRFDLELMAPQWGHSRGDAIRQQKERRHQGTTLPAQAPQGRPGDPQEDEEDDPGYNTNLRTKWDVCIPKDEIWDPAEGKTRGHMIQLHHYAFGRPWALGSDNFEFLLSRGLQPEERFLDFGSGALRNGIWLIEYLQTGNYYGVEYDTEMFKAGRDYEIPLRGLSSKKPHLYNNVADGKPGLEQFGVKFDRIMAFAVLIHFKPDSMKVGALTAFSNHLKVGGKLYLSHRTPYPKEQMLKRWGLKFIYHETQQSRFAATKNEWFEFEKVDR